MVHWYWWLAFLVGFLSLLLFDLLVLHNKPHRMEAREAAFWATIWIGLGVAFTGVIWYVFDGATAQAYITGYLIEESLSVDNLFVFVVIFNYFKVPAAYQHRVLFWGILGALFLRGIFIILGAALLARFRGWRSCSAPSSSTPPTAWRPPAASRSTRATTRCSSCCAATFR